MHRGDDDRAHDGGRTVQVLVVPEGGTGLVGGLQKIAVAVLRGGSDTPVRRVTPAQEDMQRIRGLLRGPRPPSPRTVRTLRVEDPSDRARDRPVKDRAVNAWPLSKEAIQNRRWCINPARSELFQGFR